MMPLRQNLIRLAGTGLLALATGLSAAAIPERDHAWRFNVYLDDKRIGWHEFEFDPAASTVRSEARYDVRFLFISAYRYAHQSTEVWDGHCLRRVDARTDDNGRLSSLQGERDGEAFMLRAPTGHARLPACVQSFAYWDPSILSATRLLNAQTGEYQPIEALTLGPQQIIVRGHPVTAQAYRITAQDLQIDLWYSNDREWLGLQSRTRDGRMLRYEIQ